MVVEPRPNRLLQLLDAEVLEALSPVAHPVRFRELLYEPGTPSLYAYFPVNAVISLVSTMKDGASTEVALIGREGMIGLAGVLGTREGATAAVVQVGGDALRVPIAVLRRECLRLPSLRAVLDLYTEAHLIQVAQMAACNRLHSVEARLARWLLEVSDRIDAEYFRLPQEFMAQMLGIHRPTVSLALRALRDAGVVAYRGRSITVADRPGLEHVACECYGVLRREFDRLLRSSVSGLRASPAATAGSASGPGEYAAALETMREISGRLLLATIREQEARDEAEAANRAKDEFLAMVSHELRTPLNAILGWSAILSERPNESPERALKVIRRNAEALLKLIEELLDVSRVTRQTLSIRPLGIDFGDLVCSAVDAVKPGADLKGVRIGTTMPDAFPAMTGDPDRLRQVLLNVLSNALKVTDAGGAIDVRAGQIGQFVWVAIHDSGIGIAPDELPHVFERFRQGVDGLAGTQGLGLGLTLARVLVELHGGTIQVTSPGLGQGTTCTIEVPIVAKPVRAASPAGETHPVGGSALPHSA